MVVFDQNPESKRMISSPVAPARRSRATSSSTNRLVPRCRPLPHPDMEELTGPGPSGEEGVVAELLRVAVAGPVLAFPHTGQIVESRSTTNRSSLGPAPNDQARRSASAKTASNWRVWPKVKERKNVPNMDGAITRCGSTDSVAPDRSRSAWSMWLPPATMACTRVNTLCPGSSTDTTGQVDHLVDQVFEAKPDHQGGHQQQPGVSYQIRVIEGHLDAVDSAQY
jgi:hypothetical protein